MSADGLVLDRVCDDVLGGGDQLIDLLHGQIGDVNEVSRHGVLLSEYDFAPVGRRKRLQQTCSFSPPRQRGGEKEK